MHEPTALGDLPRKNHRERKLSEQVDGEKKIDSFSYKKLYWIIHVAGATCIILTVGLANGRPSVFPDTAWYYSQGEYFASRLGIETKRSHADQYVDPTSVMPNSQAMQKRLPVTIAGGRSPFYGLLLFVTTETGTLWLLAAIQAFTAAWVICILSRAVFPSFAPRNYYAMIFLLNVFTSISFYTAFAMPDIFTGLLIISIAAMTVYRNRINLMNRTALWIIIMCSISFHNGNVLLTFALTAVALVVLVAFGKPLRIIAVRAGWIATAIAAALISVWAFGVAYQADVGVGQRSPPFLMARLIADGPGRDYLAAACPAGASPTLCRFMTRPMASEDEILWSENPARGLFNLSDYETRMHLKDEELAFVVAVIAQAPLTTLRDAIGNGIIQLGEFYVLEPLRNPASFLKIGWWRHTAIERIVPDMEVCERNFDACEPRVDGVLLAILHITVVLASIAFISYTILKILRSGLLVDELWAGREDLRLLLCAAIIMASGVVLNAFICGALSGHFARYQARVVWIIPLLAILIRGWRFSGSEKKISVR